MDPKHEGLPSSVPAAGTPAAEDERNKWYEAAVNAAQDLHDMTMIWDKTRDALDVATNENLRALAYSIAQRNVAERLKNMGMGAEAQAAVEAAVSGADGASLADREKDHGEEGEPMGHEGVMRGRSFREDRRGRSRRRSPPREASFSGNSLNEDEGVREETSTALTRREGIGDEDDEGELVLTGFDLKTAMNLDDPVALKEQLRWLHDLAARQERMLDEFNGENVRMLENNHKLALRVIHQEKELEEVNEAYHLALEYTPTERITDGSEGFSADISSIRQDAPLLLKDDEHRQQPLALTDGEPANDMQAGKATVAPGTKDLRLSANGDMPGSFGAAPEGSLPPVFPDAHWVEDPSGTPPASSLAVVGGRGEAEGQVYPDLDGPSKKVGLNGNGYHDPLYGTAPGGPSAFGPSHGNSGREDDPGLGDKVSVVAYDSNTSWSRGQDALFEPSTVTAVEGNGSGEYPWGMQEGNGGGGGGGEGEFGGGTGQDVSSSGTDPAISASLSLSDQAIQPAADEAPPTAAVGAKPEEMGAEAAGMSQGVTGNEQSRSQEPADNGESQATSSSLPPPPILPLPHPGQPMSSLRRPPPYTPSAAYGAATLANPFGGSSRSPRNVSKNTRVPNGANPEEGSGFGTGLGGALGGETVAYGAAALANPFGGSSRSPRHVSKNTRVPNGANPEEGSGFGTGLGGALGGETVYENGQIAEGVSGGAHRGLDYAAQPPHSGALGMSDDDSGRLDASDVYPAPITKRGVTKEGESRALGNDGEIARESTEDVVTGTGVQSGGGGEPNEGEDGPGNGPRLAGGEFETYSDPWAGTGIHGVGDGAGDDDYFASGV